MKEGWLSSAVRAPAVRDRGRFGGGERCSSLYRPFKVGDRAKWEGRSGGAFPKIPALREALEGHFDAHHALWIGAILAPVDFLDEQIDWLSDAIEKQIRPFAGAVELL